MNRRGLESVDGSLSVDQGDAFNERMEEMSSRKIYSDDASVVDALREGM